MAEPRNIWSLHGGLRLDDHKETSSERPLQRMPLPERLVLPLHPHTEAEP